MKNNLLAFFLILCFSTIALGQKSIPKLTNSIQSGNQFENRQINEMLRASPDMGSWIGLKVGVQTNGGDLMERSAVTKEAHKLLKRQLGSDIPIMKDRIGLNLSGPGSGTWETGKEVIGAWREDIDDPVWNAGDMEYGFVVSSAWEIATSPEFSNRLLKVHFGAESSGGLGLSQEKQQGLLGVRSTLVRRSQQYFPLNYVIDADTLTRSDSTIPDHSSKTLVVLKEAGLGVLLGAGLSLPGGLIGGLIGNRFGNWWTGFAGFHMGTYAGYVAGSSLGVYFVAKGQKPDVSLLGTLASGLLGSGIGIGVNIASGHKGVARAAPFILPIITSIIYTEFIE